MGGGELMLESWELNLLGVYDVASSSRSGGLRHWFDFVDGAGDIPGDFMEFGVFRGRSLIATALLLKSRQSKSRAVGFDTFSGFPSMSDFDLHERFEDLLYAGEISSDHFERVLKNKIHLDWLGRGSHPMSSSSSGNFSNTSEEHVRDLIEYTQTASYIELFVGQFGDLVKEQVNAKRKLAGALIDCDLFDGYQVALDYVWPRLSPGGMIFLDEYYSLKFPGPRFAVNSFCEKVGIAPTLLEQEDSWERWAILK